MARVRGIAHEFWESGDWEVGDRSQWRLRFKEGWERKLRIGGFYAGHPTLRSMKEALAGELRTQPQPLGCDSDESPGRGGDGESSSWRTQSEIARYAHEDEEDEETFEYHKRRKTTTLDYEEDVPSDWCTLDGTQDKLHRSRAKNRSTSPLAVSESFASEEAPCSSSGKRDRDTVHLAAAYEFNRGGHVLDEEEAYERARMQLGGKRRPEAVSDMYEFNRRGTSLGGQEADESARMLLGGKRRPETGVADMYVLKCADRLVPITDLPMYVKGAVCGGTGDQDIFLTGRFGGRTKSLPVDMWKLVLSPTSEPGLMVCTTEGVWLLLQQPLGCYLKMICDVYVLAHFLDLVKKNPSTSLVAVQKHLASECSMYGQEPFVERLSKHLRVIRSFVEVDEDMKSARVLRTIFPNIFTKYSTELKGNSCQQSREVLRSVLGLDGPRALDNDTEMDDKRQDVMWVDASFGGGSSVEGYVPKEVTTEHETKTKKILGTHWSELVAREDKKLKRSRVSQLDHENGKHDTEKVKKNRRSSWAVSGNRLRWEDSHTITGGGVSRPKEERKSCQRSQTKTTKLDDPPICVICDDGGDLLICDGPCSRYFHAFPGIGNDSHCPTLGISRKEAKTERWYCKNCEHQRHQCFVCGELGSTDTDLGRPEVYMCEVPSCKRFYHAHCVAELVDFPNWRTKANGIRNGTERLICPRHKCDTCRLTEMTPGKLVQCRRCPKAWHRECFTNYSLSCELRTTTIWSHDQQEFVYCKQHKINPTTMTPSRDHVRFPEVVENTKMKKIRFKSSGLKGTIIERQYCETLPPTSLAAEMGLLSQ